MRDSSLKPGGGCPHVVMAGELPTESLWVSRVCARGLLWEWCGPPREGP
jgi:hypothetical protein